MPSTTKKAAPASTPRMPGSASGLRVWPCISAPASPSAIPTPIPSTVRGTRSERTTTSFSVPVGDQMASHTGPIGIGLAPTARLASATSASSTTSPATTSRRRRRSAPELVGAVAEGWPRGDGRVAIDVTSTSSWTHTPPPDRRCGRVCRSPWLRGRVAFHVVEDQVSGDRPDAEVPQVVRYLMCAATRHRAESLPQRARRDPVLLSLAQRGVEEQVTVGLGELLWTDLDKGLVDLLGL